MDDPTRYLIVVDKLQLPAKDIEGFITEGLARRGLVTDVSARDVSLYVAEDYGAKIGVEIRGEAGRPTRPDWLIVTSYTEEGDRTDGLQFGEHMRLEAVGPPVWGELTTDKVNDLIAGEYLALPLTGDVPRIVLYVTVEDRDPIVTVTPVQDAA